MEVVNCEKNKVDMLNIIRFLAFIMVFCLHAKNFAPEGWNQIRIPWLTYTPAWAGVWIFFVLSGYGIGVGFLEGRYPVNCLRDILCFWWGRFKKIAPLYYLYLFFVMLFVSPTILIPNSEHITLIVKLLLFLYDPKMDSYGFGIVWYLCTLIKLYFIAPAVFLLLRRVLKGKKRNGMIAIVSCVAGGMLLRLIAKYVMARTGTGAWHIDVYKPFYFNLDFFVGGFCLSRYKMVNNKENSPIWKKFVGLFVLLLLILYNSKIYYTASILKTHITSSNLFLNYWGLYQYILPSIYCMVILFNIKINDIDRDYRYKKLSVKNVCRNPLRIFDWFPKIMLICYLFHANVLRSVGNAVSTAMAGEKAFAVHLLQMFLAFIVTIIFACILLRVHPPVKYQ